MKQVQSNRLLSLHNVQGYLRENATVLGEAVPGELRSMLDGCIAQLLEAAGQQDGCTRLAAGSVADQHAKRRALIRDHLGHIARIATLQKELVPELVSLRVTGSRLPVELLVAHAHGMADAVTPWKDLFVSAGCRPDFIDALRSAADELLDTLHERALFRARAHSATTALRTRLARARKVVEVIDGFMQSALAGDPDRLAGWKLVKRVPRVRRRAAETEAEARSAELPTAEVESVEMVPLEVESTALPPLDVMSATLPVVEAEIAAPRVELVRAVAGRRVALLRALGRGASRIARFRSRVAPAAGPGAEYRRCA